MGIFAPQGDCGGIFAPGVGGDVAQATVSFARAAALLQGRAPVQNAAGEVLQSFVAIGTFTGDLQPNKGGIQRTVGGVIIDVAYNMYILGTPDLRERDRAYIDNAQVEIVAANQYGNDHCELQLRWLGR